MRISDWSSDVCSSDLLDIVEIDHAGDRGPEAELAFDLRRRKALGSLFDDEAADLAVMRVRLRPDHEHVGDRRVGDPGLVAIETVAAVGLDRARPHAARIRPCIGLDKTEAADPFA